MANDTAAEPGTSLTTPQARAPARAVMVVEDSIPIFDTARFEHYGRIAAVMANASLVPNSLRGQTREEAVANCFMVINQADRWGLDPFAVAQCASVVSGKLMWEGKLISAVIKSKLGLDLHFYFTGEKGSDAYRAYVSDVPFTEEIVAKLEPGKSPLGLRVIDGSVAEWKTTNDNWKKQPDMQLRYRGARVWCRAYEPAIMLGVYTDDEMEDLREEREVQAQAREAAPRLSAGFGDDTDRDFRAQGSPQSAEAASGSSPADGAPERTEAPQEADGGGKSPGRGRKKADPKPEPEPAADPKPEAEAQPEPAAEEKPEVADESTSGETTTSPGSSDASPEPEEEITTAPAGEVYLIVGEGFVDGRRTTYQNGQPFSSVTEKGTNSLTAYDKHAPMIEKAPPPAEETKPEAGESPFAIAHAKINEADGWLGIKQHLRTLAKSDAWATTEEEGKRMIRMVAWERFRDLREAGKDASDPAEDLSLFRLWLEFGAEDKEQVDGLFRLLYRSAAYRDASEPDRKAIGELVDKRKAALPSAT